MNEIINKLKERLVNNDINTEGEFRHELREITQEFIMAGLSKTDFFTKATFHGGTSLRMMYHIDRYSEDLDFTLDKANIGFEWKPYLNMIQEFVGQYGCSLETVDKSKVESNVKKAFVKDSSIEQMMNMSWTRKGRMSEKIRVKLELDANPPFGSVNEIKTYSYPVKFNVKMQNLSSLFAGKCHALLCREYEKGRDWFDLKWFVNRGVEPNYNYLDSMLEQHGPWKGKLVNSNKTWISAELLKKNELLNFDEINEDIRKFTNSKSHIILDKNIISGIMQKFNSLSYGRNNGSEDNNPKKKAHGYDYDMR